MQPRIHFPSLSLGNNQLDPESSHHLAVVLRAKPGERVVLFDGKGQEGVGVIRLGDRSAVCVDIESIASVDRESPVDITVVQALCTGDKMDWVVQKSTELGASRIVPLVAARSVLKLEGTRAEKRIAHWQAIAESASAQSGRTRVPQVTSIQSLQSVLDEWARARSEMGPERMSGWLLDPFGREQLSKVPLTSSVTLLIGPEAGWTDDEETLAKRAGFTGLQAGPRILRTETAALAVLAAIATRSQEF